MTHVHVRYAKDATYTQQKKALDYRVLPPYAEIRLLRVMLFTELRVITHPPL